MEEEEQKIREEANTLIKQTKNMMKNLQSQKGIKNRRTNSKGSYSGAYNTINTGHHHNQNLSVPIMDYSPRKEISNGTNIISNQDNLLSLSKIEDKVELKATIRRLTDKVYELTIINQELEKENKKQKQTIESLQKKIKLNENKINSLNKEMTMNISDDPVVENSKLKRKIAALENQITENNFVYEKVIDEYKTKLNELLNQNDIINKNLRDVSNSNENLVKASKSLQRNLEEKTNQVKNYSIEYENKENLERQHLKKIEKLENHLRVLLAMIKGLANKENNNYHNIRTLIGRFNNIFPYQGP